MSKIAIITLFWMLTILNIFGKDQNSKPNNMTQSQRNLKRSIVLVNQAMNNYFTGEELAMARYFNPCTRERSEEKGSIWMYTSSIEAVNAILQALEQQKSVGELKLFNLYYDKYISLLNKLYEHTDYYMGTFRLTSYTQTQEWSVYGVDRGKEPGKARVEGIYNVYDDQQWLVRELIESYRLTQNKKYLEQAEYLTEYILDGWDGHLNEQGEEFGGITWGPGYVSKHSCSNGPMVSPLVWLSEIYKGKSDEIKYLYIVQDQTRKSRWMKKSDYYLQFAMKVYKWQKVNLLRNDGVYADLMGGCDPNCQISFDTIQGQIYRKHNPLKEASGRAYSYNSGTMLSGAADLYHSTGKKEFLDDLGNLSSLSFDYFAKKEAALPGYYSYYNQGFSNWFNDVLMRGYADASGQIPDAKFYLSTFQHNLDYAWDHFLYNCMLPSDLLKGWSNNKGNEKVEVMFTFAFASEYARLAQECIK